MSDSLRERYLLWREAGHRRSAAGELRASAAEREALERFTAALEECSADERVLWERERASLDAVEGRLCACAHPVAHHDSSGSCFHVIGCSTGCDCVRM